MEDVMSRKRTSDSESPETSTSTTEPPAAQPASSTGADQPATQAGSNQPSFAERVGQKKKATFPDPFGIASDYVAGVRLLESRHDRLMAIRFGEGRPEDKPSQAVIDKMKEAGFRWNAQHKIWAIPVRSDNALTTRIDAENLFQEVSQMIREEKGIPTGQEVPF
jgi:hypothetical protein